MGKDDLCIVCTYWGNWCHPYGVHYVNRLYRGVQRHLTLPHRFVCFTDHIPGGDGPGLAAGIEVLPMDVPDWRWNLRKMIVYKPQNGLSGRVLLFDLDVVIVGSIDDIAQYAGEFATCEAAYRPGGVGGSIIGFAAGFGKRLLWDPLVINHAAIANATMGSERKYYTQRLCNGRCKMDFWQDMYPGQVLSYKVDCKNGIPEGARVVRFHGKPRPHEARDRWLTQHWI